MQGRKHHRYTNVFQFLSQCFSSCLKGLIPHDVEICCVVETHKQKVRDTSTLLVQEQLSLE